MLNVSLSVVLAGYNEENNVATAVERTAEVLESNFKEWEIILVDDGSKDNTFTKMQTYASTMKNVRFLPNYVNLNFGASVLRGLYAAQMDYVIYNAFDLPLDPEKIPNLIREMAFKENVDCMILERVGYNPSIWRKITSAINRLMLIILFPNLVKGTPVLNYIQIFCRKILRDITPLARSPIFVWPELIFRVKLNGYRWENKKVKCTNTDRKGAFGKPHDIMWGIYEMFRFKLLEKKAVQSDLK